MRERIVTALVVIAAALGGSGRHSRLLAADAGAAFARCAPGARHTAVPHVDGLTYDRARKKLLAAGWAPRVTRAADGTMPDPSGEFLGDAPTLDEGNLGIFWARGYREVENCAGTGLGQCVFNFSDGRGNRLQIQTAGEEDPDGSYHATVERARPLCRRL